MEARSRFLRRAQRIMMMALALAFGFVVVATAFPQQRTLEKLEANLKVAQERARMVRGERDSKRIELRALREDPSYLEVHARDRLDYGRDGERILRFRREP